MSPRDDLEGLLKQFGNKLREESDLAERVCARLETPPQPVPRRASSWLGGLTMRQRITLGGMSVAVAIGLVVFLGSYLSARPVFAQAVEKIRAANTYSFDSVMQPTKPGLGEPTRSKGYWQSPGSMRMEFFRSGGSEPDMVTIVFRDKPGIRIDHQAKFYWTEPPRRGETSRAMWLRELGRYSGEARRKLGRKEIGDSVSAGFEIDFAKIDPNVPSGTMELWIDVKTQLPTQIDIRQGEMPVTMRMETFKWNEELSPEMFDVTPPDGYALKTRPEKSVDEQVAQIRKAMKLYAELSGGHYPKVRKVYGDVTRDEMFKMVGIEIPPKPEQYRDPRYMEIQNATFGLARINVIQRENEDAAFYGIEVGPNDADRALFRWKLPDGRYQVVFGDLRSEAVSAERLKEIESL